MARECGRRRVKVNGLLAGCRPAAASDASAGGRRLAPQAGATPPARPAGGRRRGAHAKNGGRALRTAVDDARIANAVLSTLHRSGDDIEGQQSTSCGRRPTAPRPAPPRNCYRRLVWPARRSPGGCARADAPKALATAGAFDAASPPKAVVNAPFVASQLARTAAPGSGDGAACEKALKRATLERYLPRLLRSEDAQTRAKACNLVGNLAATRPRSTPALVEARARRGERARLRDPMRVGR